MYSSTHPIIILSDSDVEDAFSFTDYTPASSDYSPASPRNTSSDSKTESDPSEDLSEDRSAPLAITPFLDDPLETELQESHTQIAGFQREQIKHDDEIVLTRVRISTLRGYQVTMALLPPGFLKPLYPDIMAMINAQDIEHIIPPTPPRDIDPPVGSPIPSSLSSSVVSSSPVRSTTPPPDYPFDESIFAELDNSLWIIPLRIPLGSEHSLRGNKSRCC
ncbi:hypothetical protein Tco_0619215 [Tanacetum coccineum]